MLITFFGIIFSLEIRIQELILKNSELEVEVERLKSIMTEEKKKGKRKGNLDGLVNKFEQRNVELEEREEEARRRLNMMETAWPAIMAWNMFRMCQNKDMSDMPSTAAVQQIFGNAVTSIQDEQTDLTVFKKLEELIDDQKKLRRQYEKAEEAATMREKALKERIEELEEKAAKDRESLEGMTACLRTLRLDETPPEETDSLGSINSGDVEVFEELKKLAENEIKMRKKIEDLERKEQAYMQTLQQADEIWATMEADYKKRLKEAEGAGAELQNRVSQLEQTQSMLEKELESHSRILGESEAAERQREMETEIEGLKSENERLQKLIPTTAADKQLAEQIARLERLNEELKVQIERFRIELPMEQRKSKTLEEELESVKEEVSKEKILSEKLEEELESVKEEVSKEKMLSEQLEEELEAAKEEVSKEKMLSEKLVKDMEEQNKNMANMELSLHTQVGQIKLQALAGSSDFDDA